MNLDTKRLFLGKRQSFSAMNLLVDEFASKESIKAKAFMSVLKMD